MMLPVLLSVSLILIVWFAFFCDIDAAKQAADWAKDTVNIEDID